jgi:hypothetical protein
VKELCPGCYREENSFENRRHPDRYRDWEPAQRSGGLNPHEKFKKQAPSYHNPINSLETSQPALLNAVGNC